MIFSMKKLFLIMLSLVLITGVKADEGMWMLPLIQKLNIQKMQGMGCTLTADQIYSDQHASLKDAVIVFGGGCSGVLVSNQGLIFTNHHCGFDAIQKASTVDHNYLKNGFAAKTFADEIPSPGLTVKFLVKVEDVTQRVLSQLPDSLTGKLRTDKQDSIEQSIAKEAQQGTDYDAIVKPFFAGNQYYLFVFETFKDIRFVFAPPVSVGKFGGETDNWMWPRHTGDFSVFRVYCSPDGKPADYSKENVPYSPKRFAVISNKGYQPGDFTMILGNPGRTSRYLTSWGVINRMNAANMAMIEVRGVKQNVWKSFMNQNDSINLAYAGKFARSANYWKNSIGMNNAIQKLHIIEDKEKAQKQFTDWVNSDPARKQKYGNVLNTIQVDYQKIFPSQRALNYLRESFITGAELPIIARQADRLIKKNLPKDSLMMKLSELYKDYYPQVDQATLAALLELYKKSVNRADLPAFYAVIDKKFNGSSEKYAAFVFEKSAFSSLAKLTRQLQKGRKHVENDPALAFEQDVHNTFTALEQGDYNTYSAQLNDAERLYEEGIMEMAAQEGKAIYPDANFTMRMTYGTVGGYQPADAVSYRYYTTTKGILQKENETNPEFCVAPELKKAIEENNFGSYIDPKTGDMHVDFLSNNDITGGNSGSPIFNGKGELLGLAFDGNWEAMSGDIVFDPSLQRTINVDIRYILFIMDKVEGAQRLINELTIQ
jgi:hypothetical protein